MPDITYDAFLTSSTLALQRGAGAATSGVHRDWVAQFIPAMVNQLAEAVAEDPARRALLLKAININIARQANGAYEGTIDQATYRQMLVSALCYSSCYDNGTIVEENNQPLELLYKDDWRRIVNTARYLNPAYGYYSLRGDKLIARPPDSISDFSAQLQLYLPSIPDFNTVPLPYELVDDAQTILWEMAGKFLTAKAK